MEEIKLAPASEAEIKAKAEADAKALAEQDPLKVELEKVKTKRTHKEKLIYKKNEIDKELRELDKEAGVETGLQDDTDDDTPFTKGDFKKLQAETTTKTALDLANNIEADTERELVKFHINNTIKSTGNPKEDLKLAQAIVNSTKNAKIAELAQQKPGVKRGSSNGGGAPYQEEIPELTPQELRFTKAPWNLSKEVILAKRKEKQDLRPDKADIEDQQ